MDRAAASRAAVAALLALVILAGAAAAAFGWVDGIAALLQWARELHGVGWFAFAAVNVFIVASGVLPASLAGIAAGVLYGVPLGFAIAAASTMAGALVTLAASRSLARGWIERFSARRPRVQNLDRLFAQDGVRVVALIRLSPVMPFAAASYALGLSSVSVRDYVLGTTASLPALLGYVVLGQIGTASLAGGEMGWVRWTALGVGALATVWLTLHLGRLLARAGVVPADLRRTLDAALRRPPEPGRTASTDGPDRA